MTIKIKTGVGWKNIPKLVIKTASGWKNITKGVIKTSLGWKIFFTSVVIPSIQTRVQISKTTNYDNTITLTGTNYHWSDASPGTLSLVYYFKKADGTVVNTGSITNPSSGASNTKDYTIQTADLDKNTDTDFFFVVECTNTTSGQVGSSTSLSTTVNGARDITNLAAGTQSYTSAPISFTPGAYNSSYLVNYSYSGGSGSQHFSASGNNPTTLTLTGLSANTTYTISVTPYSGARVFNLVSGYPGNTSSTISVTTLQVIAPTQISSPTVPGGTGEYNTSVTTGSGGSYQASTYISKTTRLVGSSSANATPTNGSTSEAGTVLVSPYTVVQSAFTSPYTKFYTRDDVLAVDGVTTYYYYSSPLSAYLSEIVDNFNRADGLITQTSSGLIYNATYSSYANTWYTTSNKAWSSHSVSSNTTSNPKMVIESGGKTNISGSIQLPETTSAGYGIAFWVTSAGSWWSASTNCSTTTTTTTSCGGTNYTGLASCTNGSNVGDYCNCSSYNVPVTTYPCNGAGGTSSTCTNGPGTAAGQVCGCSYNTSTCTGNSGTFYSTASEAIAGCTGSCYGSCTIYVSSTCYQFQNTTSANQPLSSTSTCNASNVGKYQTGSLTQLPNGLYSYQVCAAVSCTVPLSGYCCGSYTAPYYTYSTTTSSTTNYTYYQSQKNISTTTTNYDTYLQIYSSNGSSVTSMASQKIDTSTSGYIDLYLIGVTTSGDQITAKAYSTISNQVGSDLIYTRTGADPVKSLSNGTSAHGVIKMYTAANEAGYIDNLSITLS